VGSSEAAEILGVALQYINRYRKQGRFPEPKIELKCGPIWEREQIKEFKPKIVRRAEKK
jgi:predicted site-specific integrase-resolvase